MRMLLAFFPYKTDNGISAQESSLESLSQSLSSSFEEYVVVAAAVSIIAVGCADESVKGICLNRLAFGSLLSFVAFKISELFAVVESKRLERGKTALSCSR